MDLLLAEFEDACRRFNGKNFSSLDEVDRVLVTIWGLEADVNNGGFAQYYFNGSGDQAFFAPAALNLIGAHSMETIVLRANSLFGADGPNREQSERRRQLLVIAKRDQDHQRTWDELDLSFYAYPDDIAELLVKFLKSRGRWNERTDK